MYLPINVHHVLKEKLQYDDSHLKQLSDNADLSARVLGYLHIVRSPRIGRSEKILAIEKLMEIRRQLSQLPEATNQFLNESLNRHYSFASNG